MRVSKAELFELTLPLVEPFVISGGAIRERRSLVVVLHDEAGLAGYGESPPFELPFYSEETLATARHLITRVLLPRVIDREFESPEALDAVLRVGVRGNPFARAGVETAAWDLEAHRRHTGLAALLAERLGTATAGAVPCGVALGIPEDRQPGTLAHRVADALRLGYRRVKIKVMPGWDEIAVRAARDAMAGVDLPLTVDANGAYEWPAHEANLRALDDAGLLY
ncbi:MAG: enolase C-terminal domain-like protein, partial [Gemmatimonadales bacterium]